MIDQSKTGSIISQIIIITTLFLSTSFLSKLTVGKMPGQIHFAELNPHVLTFFHLVFNLESRILSTTGDLVSTINTSEATAAAGAVISDFKIQRSK
jgi:hypothetical protein